MRIYLSVLGLLLVVTGCGAYCNDYKDDPLGPPPGCECLWNAYGCGPFDQPTWNAAQPAAAARVLSSANRYNLSLQRVENTCPYPFRDVIEGVVTLKRRGDAVSARMGSTLKATGRARGRRVRLSRSGSYAACSYTISARTNLLPAAAAEADATVRADCGITTCSARYAGTLQRVK